MGDAFGMLFCLSVSMSVRMRNLKTIAQIDLIFSHKNSYYNRSSVYLYDDRDRDPCMDSRKYLIINHQWEIGQNMPSKYGTASNCYGENMSYDVIFISFHAVMFTSRFT